MYRCPGFLTAVEPTLTLIELAVSVIVVYRFRIKMLTRYRAYAGETVATLKVREVEA